MNTEKKQVELLTASEALVKHDLAWDVVKCSISVNDKIATDYKAITREDTGDIFQIAKNRYEPIQNKTIASLFDEILGTGQAKFHSAGSYKNGAIVWFRAQVTESNFNVLPGDEMATYIKMIASHDGSVKLLAFPEVERLICSNGMTAMRKDYTKVIGVKHTINALPRFTFNAREVLKTEIEYFKTFAEHMRQLTKKHMTSLEIDNFLLKLFDVVENKEVSTKTKNQIEKVKELTEVGTGMDIEGVKGTAYGVYNAVTEYIDRYRSTKGDKENREYSANFGSGKALREKAFELLVK